ncbi:uncharacterized protein F4812DRAFT_304127 [Daldinia caldariorum]|uniref:uncharacterized protein n=1 Tax=Daldinia caldariorum TaxID=326644 RepID=UPI00200883D6|nr:uncharacterized protein F4812DRAFT_304127 [Daldinia caldariorum]KAI1469811.1 hypothetical protein F4812DRAFT_304127 [Daldinia caldariorum]
MKFHAILSGPVLIASSTLALRGPLLRVDSTGPVLTTTTVLTAQIPSPAAGFSSSSVAVPVPVPSGSQGIGPKCGKGYTYCGYMLTANGHNFAPNDISKAYCNGLSELCTNGKPKTDVSQAVFVCMNEQPSSVELLCACSSKCRNDAESNFIAHCDKPCINA